MQNTKTTRKTERWNMFLSHFASPDKITPFHPIIILSRLRSSLVLPSSWCRIKLWGSTLHLARRIRIPGNRESPLYLPIPPFHLLEYVVLVPGWRRTAEWMTQPDTIHQRNHISLTLFSSTIYVPRGSVDESCIAGIYGIVTFVKWNLEVNHLLELKK